ncbi:MAG: DUF2807 domain-containing protein [Bacteroidales bacterium]|nr:DUF2807 domain-containing protein [Bacteroidales bacterium]MBR4228618.1 DUF2807 domain-containing protein [Bacteroidales bacterium]
MKRIYTIALSAAMLAAATSCTFVRVNPNAFSKGDFEYIEGSSNLQSKSYTVPQFTGIDTFISADIEYSMTEGDPSVTIEAPDNLIDKLNLKVEDGVLKVRFDDDRHYSFKTIRVKASSSTLEALSIRGAGDFDARSGIDCKRFNVDVQGAGDVDMAGLRCEGDLNIDVRGAGDITVSGLSCQKVKVDVQGAGDVDLSGKAESADLSIQGAGDIDITRLEVVNVSSSVAGMGSIKRK